MKTVISKVIFNYNYTISAGEEFTVYEVGKKYKDLGIVKRIIENEIYECLQVEKTMPDWNKAYDFEYFPTPYSVTVYFDTNTSIKLFNINSVTYIEEQETGKEKPNV